MPKSATDVMQEMIYAAVIDAIAALKTASRGVPNNLLRDLNALHANTTFADLPKELQTSITASVRAAFTRLLKEGYSVSSGQPAQRGGPPPRRDGGAPGGRPPGRGGDRPGGDRPRGDRPRGDRPGGSRPGGNRGGPGGRSDRGPKGGGSKGR